MICNHLQWASPIAGIYRPFRAKYGLTALIKRHWYIHLNPCRYETILALLPEDYLHSSATYYYTGVQGIYPVTSYMDMQDIDLETLR